MQRSIIRIAGAAVAAGLVLGGAALAQESHAPQPSRTSYPELTTGQQVYEGICQGCHMPQGKGAVGAGMYPALAANPKLGPAAYPAMVVLKGQKAMPAFGQTLNDGQVAAVVDYIRSGFGNSFSDKTAPADVGALR